MRERGFCQRVVWQRLLCRGAVITAALGWPVLPAAGAAAAFAPDRAAPEAPAKPLQLDDLQRIVSLREATVSPDGKSIAVIVSTPNWKTDKADLEIDLVDVASGARRSLTYQRTGLASPQWSHDGTRLAFLALDSAAGPGAPPEGGAPSEPQTQIFVMPMNGGDAIRVTSTAHGVDSFAWSPDDRQLAFVTADDPPNAKAIKEHDDAFRVTDNHFLTRAALTPSHLWRVPSAGGEAKRLTQGSFSLQTDELDDTPVPAWSPDGHRIEFTQFPGPYWGPSMRSVIASVSADGGDPSILVAAEGSGGLKLAPAGGGAAFVRARNGDRNNGDAVYVLSGGASRDVTEALARNIHAFAWLPDGNALILEGDDGTHSVLWRQPLQGASQRLDLGGIEASADFSVSKTGVIAFVGSTAAHPGELYVMNATSAKPRRLTNVNALVDGLALGRCESLDWQGPGGFAEDGILTYPVGFQPGHRYPLVVVAHGGPAAASTLRFSVLPQLLAAAGFVVLQPNYRGSTNLGDAYQHAIFRDTGTGPGEDVMAGVAAVQKLGIVDESRMGMSGWSYGGYMTAWLTGHYPVWKAAMAGAALTDWVADYTLAYYQEGDVYLFGGSPWSAEFRSLWRDQSPIAYADHVTAPTLILGDVGDPNVPLLNSYEWYHALRDAGVPVEFYAYPVDTHFPKDIVRTTDVYRRWVGWMVDHLK